MQQNKERKLEGFEVSLFQDVFAKQKQYDTDRHLLRCQAERFILIFKKSN